MIRFSPRISALAAVVVLAPAVAGVRMTTAARAETRGEKRIIDVS